MTNRCDLVEAQCRCELDADHTSPHYCACGGSWTFDAAGQFVVVAFPKLQATLEEESRG